MQAAEGQLKTTKIIKELKHKDKKVKKTSKNWKKKKRENKLGFKKLSFSNSGMTLGEN